MGRRIGGWKTVEIYIKSHVNRYNELKTMDDATMQRAAENILLRCSGTGSRLLELLCGTDRRTALVFYYIYNIHIFSILLNMHFDGNCIVQIHMGMIICNFRPNSIVIASTMIFSVIRVPIQVHAKLPYQMLPSHYSVGG